MVEQAGSDDRGQLTAASGLVRPDDLLDGRDFAQALTTLRMAAGLSVRDVARATAIPAATLGGYFSGRHLPARPKEGLLPILRACGSAEHDDAHWIEALARARRHPGPRPQDAVRPYPGLRSFDLADAEWFFGREEPTQNLLDTVNSAFDCPAATPMVVVIGSSGSGKSSLVRAGLLPVVDARTITLTPGTRPVAELATRLAPVCGRVPAELLAEVERHARDGTPQTVRVDGPPLLLVIDQCEELFASVVSEVERSTFLALLDAVLTADSNHRHRVVAVLVLRSDFFRQASEEPVLRRSLQERQVLLGAMSVTELRSAIVEPARRAGVTVDDDLVELILRDLHAYGTSNGTHDPGALPLMSHALMEAWQGTRRGRLTRADYLRTGGIEHAAQRTAESTYQGLDESSRVLARRIFLRLVHVEDSVPLTRRRARRTELVELSDDPAQVECLLDQFVDARLLTSHADELSLSHESLLLAWPRLAQWIEHDLSNLRRHRQLTAAARQWDSEGRGDDGLWRGPRLEDSQRWLTADPERAADLNRTERAFLAYSLRLEAGRQAAVRRRLRRQRQLLVTVSTFAVLSCVLAVLAGFNQTRASRAEHAASQQRDLAQSRQLAVEATQLEASDPSLASQLALAGYQVSPTPEARSALLDSLAVPTPTRLLGQPGPTPIALSRDGQEIAIANAVSGTVQLYRRPIAGAVPSHVGTVPGDGTAAQLFALAFAPRAPILATGGTDSKVRLWSIAEPSHPKLLAPPLAGIADAVEAVAFSPDGRLMAAGGGGKAVLLWDVSSPTHPRRLPPLAGLPGVVQSVCFSPDGSVLAIGGQFGLLKRWRVNGHSMRLLPALPDPPPATTTVNSVAFSPVGSMLAAGSTDASVRVWHMPSTASQPTELATLTGSSNWVNVVAFAPDGRTLAAGASDNKALVWQTGTWNKLMSLPHPGAVTALSFLPDGSRLVTGSADGAARLWPLPGPVLSGAQAAVFGLSFSDAGLLALGTAQNDHAVRLWRSLGSGSAAEMIRVVPPRGIALTGAVALSADSRRLAAGDKSGKVLLWDTSDVRRPKLLSAITGLHHTVEWLAFAPRSQVLAAASDDSVVRLWDVADPRKPHTLSTLREPQNMVFSGAFSADGKTLAAGSADRAVRLWNVGNPAAPKLLATLAPFKSYVYSVAISPNSRLLAAGSADHSIRLWDISQPNRPIQLGPALTGPNNTVFGLSFSPESRYLAAASSDGTVRTWDLANPSRPDPFTVLRATGSDVYAVAFSPDGSTLVGGGVGRDVHLWPTDTRRAITVLCQFAGDPISKAEWVTYAANLPYRPPCVDAG